MPGSSGVVVASLTVVLEEAEIVAAPSRSTVTELAIEPVAVGWTITWMVRDAPAGMVAQVERPGASRGRGLRPAMPLRR